MTEESNRGQSDENDPSSSSQWGKKGWKEEDRVSVSHAYYQQVSCVSGASLVAQMESEPESACNAGDPSSILGRIDRLIGILEKKREWEKVLQEIIVSYFPNLLKYKNLQVLKAQKTPNRITIKKTMSRHSIIKTAESQKYREKFESSLRKTTKYIQGNIKGRKDLNELCLTGEDGGQEPRKDIALTNVSERSSEGLYYTRTVVWLLRGVRRFCDPTACSQWGSSVYGISQASFMEWVAISFSRVSSWPLGQQILYHWAKEALTLYIYTHTYTRTYIYIIHKIP